jgi:LacI family transcriptional regulator
VVANTQRDDPRIRLLQERGFPFLAYGRTESTLPYAWFDFDNQAGGRLATERLLRLGHRRIGLIHALRRYTFAYQRLAGFHDALQTAGVAPAADLLHEVDLSRDAGHTAMRRLLAQPVRPTAVLVDNNLSGVGALRALAEAGLHPGRDLSLIVYDGVPADLPLPYRVTCIEQPTGELAGRTMARLVLDLLAGKPVEELHALAQPRLGEGDTDAPA